jgi:hypothetical protein
MNAMAEVKFKDSDKYMNTEAAGSWSSAEQRNFIASAV